MLSAEDSTQQPPVKVTPATTAALDLKVDDSAVGSTRALSKTTSSKFNSLIINTSSVMSNAPATGGLNPLAREWTPATDSRNLELPVLFQPEKTARPGNVLLPNNTKHAINPRNDEREGVFYFDDASPTNRQSKILSSNFLQNAAPQQSALRQQNYPIYPTSNQNAARDRLNSLPTALNSPKMFQQQPPAPPRISHSHSLVRSASFVESLKSLSLNSPSSLSASSSPFLPKIRMTSSSSSLSLSVAAPQSPELYSRSYPATPPIIFLSPPMSEPIGHPKKPNLGESGIPIHILTNFYGLYIPAELHVWQYDVRIAPETVTKVNRRVIDAFRDALLLKCRQLGNTVGIGSMSYNELARFEWKAIFDGSRTLYSPSQIPFINDEISAQVELVDEDFMRRRIQKFLVRIRKVTEIQMSKLNEYNAGILATSELPRDAIHVLEVLLRQQPSLKFTAIGRGGGSFYSDVHNTAIANALTVHQGWYQSVKPSFRQMKLNLDVSASSFYVAGSLIETVAKYFNRSHIELARPHLNDSHERKKLERFLRDVTIEILYRATGRKRYKIKGIFDKPCAQTLIVTGTGEGRVKQIVPVITYFVEKYSIVLQYPWLPCIVCGSKNDVVLPMELCFVRKNQRHIGKLNDQQLADIVKLTAVLPELRKERVSDGMRQLHGVGIGGGSILNSWGVQIASEMSVIDGRILTAPPLTFGASNNANPDWRHVITPSDGTWRIGRNIRLAEPAVLRTWGIAVFGDPNNFPLQAISLFIDSILKACVGLGMTINNRNIADIVVYAPMLAHGVRMNNDTIEATLRLANEKALRIPESLFSNFSFNDGGMWDFDDLVSSDSVMGSGILSGNKGFGGMVGFPSVAIPINNIPAARTSNEFNTEGTAQLVICILAQKNTVYEQIKKIAETDIGLMTQCVIGKHVHTTKPSYAQNLALKINVKLGGINSYVDPVHELGGLGLSSLPTIIMGADVTHPQYSSTDLSSIAAVVGTVDQKFCEYRSSVRMQNTRREIIFDLEGMTREIFEQFRIRNGCYPVRILFYRDGVNEAQLGDVVVDEVSAVRRACAGLGIGNAMLTFTVVNKRHHARFFPVRMETGESDSKGNILAGTVVDSGVTHPFEFDFYLNSHPGMQGTSKAAHYHVLFDGNKFKADTLQEITYRLCYNFARSTRAVSIVPPAYYAHLVAARARCYVSAQSGAPHYWQNNYTSSSPAMESFQMWVGNQQVQQGVGMFGRSFSNQPPSSNLENLYPLNSPSSGLYGASSQDRLATSYNSLSSGTQLGTPRINHGRARELPQVNQRLQGT
ncbi:hypothetical protein HK100_000628, partial [Physocladia obscura]